MTRTNRVRMDCAQVPETLAGAGGFEPPHGGIKVRCLTTWLRPNGPSGGAARPHIVGHTLGSNPSRIGPEYVVRNGRSVACRPQCRAAATALAGALLEGYKAALAQHNPLQGVFGRCPFGLTVGRSVAQPGSALASGARGREFESPRSDQFPANFLIGPSQPLPAYMKPPNPCARPDLARYRSSRRCHACSAV